ncbi:hypothetical protein, partial [Streptomyces sp. NPDC002215]|uniref:hypothetical protein n=1 Tax=Streptomyces sp. NPDC002215 TaxID=3154412 RepID=UPI0033246F05
MAADASPNDVLGAFSELRARKESTRWFDLCREGRAVCGGVDEDSCQGAEVCCWGLGCVRVLVHQSSDFAGGVADG